MIGSLSVLAVLVLVLVVWRVQVVLHRRQQTPVITTWPDIELRQVYGGWDANAYDAGTSHDHSIAPTASGRSAYPGPSVNRPQC